MGRGNCTNVCTAPPDSFILGSCCHDADGDNVGITCEDNVSEFYCLVKPNSVFGANKKCGAPITCDGYYVSKIYRTGAYSYAVIKTDGTVATWRTIDDDYGQRFAKSQDPYITNNNINTDRWNLITEDIANRIQPIPFGDNGAVKIYTDGYGFSAVQKKDGSFVVFGKDLYEKSGLSGSAGGHLQAELKTEKVSEIENILNTGARVVDMVFAGRNAIALKEDGRVVRFNYAVNDVDVIEEPDDLDAILYTAPNLFNPDVVPEFGGPDNPAVEIYSHRYEDLKFLGFCVVFKDRKAFAWGFESYNKNGQYSIYDVNRDGQVSALDVLVLINYIDKDSDGIINSTDPLYKPEYDVSGDGRISAVDALQVINELSRQGNNYDPENPPDENVISLVDGIRLAHVDKVYAGAYGFHFSFEDGSFWSSLERNIGYTDINNVKQLVCTQKAVCVVDGNNRVICFGDTAYGGVIPSYINAELNGTFADSPKIITATRDDFIAIAIKDIDSTQYDDRNCLFYWPNNYNVFEDEGFSTDRLGGGPTLDFRHTASNDSLSLIAGYTSQGYYLPARSNSEVISGNAEFVVTNYTAVSNPVNERIHSLHGEPPRSYLLENLLSKTDVRYTENRYNSKYYIKRNLSPCSGVVFSEKASCQVFQNLETGGFKVHSYGDYVYGGWGTTERYWNTDRTPAMEYEFSAIVSNMNSFAGITTDGAIACWGYADLDWDSVPVNTSRGTVYIAYGKWFTQNFIDDQIRDIGPNVSLHSNLKTAGFEGCSSSSSQKDFCKTEDQKKPDCNVFTGECGYGLGDFYPFVKVDKCEDCYELKSDANIGTTNFSIFNFTPGCFAKANDGGALQNFTRGHYLYEDIATVNQCNSITFANGFPNPGIFLDNFKTGKYPSGSCCVGVVCEEGYNEFAPTPQSLPCEDLKTCYDGLTEGQCYDATYRISTNKNPTPWLQFKTYHDFKENTTCSTRTGEENC